MKPIAWGAVLVLALTYEAAAQYWGERVLEKSFEQTDFFFTPSYLNPYGIGSFRSATPGLVKDPLVDFIVNPARLALDSLQWTYLYTDFRAAREVQEEPSGFYPPWVYGDRMSADMIYYPQLYVNTRRELEPVFSGALVGRPAPESVGDLTVGLTYQLVLQDDKYYSIPQDIYKTTAGYDYNGERAAAGEALPVVDKYSGKDNIHQDGNALTGFARYAFPMGLDVAAKLSRVTFTREGSFGSSNLWQYSAYSTGTSLWSNLEAREQEYSHWDVAGGVQYHFHDRLALGATAGYLWGEATQVLHVDDSSYYQSTYTSGESFYNRSGDTGHDWLHDGRTTYFGADLTSKPSAATVLTLLYRGERSNVDISLGSAILDTSYSRYSWTDNSGSITSYSMSYFGDGRSGGGEQVRRMDRVMASLQWKIDERVHLSIGAILEWLTNETRTTESVYLESRSAYWSTQGTWDSRYGQKESKDLDWHFSSGRRTFQIPILVDIRASDVLGVLLGLNRTMAQWKIDDVTLARFRYRETYSNGTTNREEDFGERYTAPTEQVTDVRTTFLAGLTVSVARAFRVRLMMVPNFHDTYDGTELEDLQWWIGLTLTP